MNEDMLLKRLAREMDARKQAEKLLEERSLELYSMNLVLQNAADQLSLQNAQQDKILEKIWTGVLLLNEEHCVVRSNDYAQRAFQQEEQSLIGVNISTLVASSNQQIGKLIALSRNVEEEQSEVEIMGYRNDGTRFPLKLTIAETLIRDKKHFIWIFRDITREKTNKAKQERLEEELRRALRLESLGTLASGLAHEINTPVQYVGDNLHFLSDAFSDLLSACELTVEHSKSSDGTAQVMESDIDLEFLKEEVPNAVSQALEGAERVSEIIRSVRNFSHPGAKEKTEFDLNEAIQATITISRNQWKYFADIDTELQPDLPGLKCMPGEINQVLLNLLVNAAQAIEEKEDKNKGIITISTRELNRYVEVRVKDTGKGIPDKIRDRVFDPFFTTKGVGKGTGQGLSLAYNTIVTGHGGKLSFETQEGVGTTFIIQLPYEQQNDMSNVERTVEYA